MAILPNLRLIMPQPQQLVTFEAVAFNTLLFRWDRQKCVPILKITKFICFQNAVVDLHVFCLRFVLLLKRWDAFTGSLRLMQDFALKINYF
jgi:hypothetical protein